MSAQIDSQLSLLQSQISELDLRIERGRTMILTAQSEGKDVTAWQQFRDNLIFERAQLLTKLETLPDAPQSPTSLDKILPIQRYQKTATSTTPLKSAGKDKEFSPQLKAQIQELHDSKEKNFNQYELTMLTNALRMRHEGVLGAVTTWFEDNALPICSRNNIDPHTLPFYSEFLAQQTKGTNQ